MKHDGVVTPHPPITRTLNETISKLMAAGHEIVEWEPSLHRELLNTLNKLYFLDGGQECYDVMKLGQEPACPMIQWILEKPEVKLTTSADSWKVCLLVRYTIFKLNNATAQLPPSRPPNSLCQTMEHLENRRPSLSRKRISCVSPPREQILGLLLCVQHSRL